jgi:hypothetical protein
MKGHDDFSIIFLASLLLNYVISVMMITWVTPQNLTSSTDFYGTV